MKNTSRAFANKIVTETISPATAMILSGLFFSVAHASVKFLLRLPPTEVAFFRALFSLVISFFWLRAVGVNPWGRNKPTLILRGTFGTLALVLYIYTLQNMPLASAVTLNYLAPIFTVLIAWLTLGERPLWVHWLLLGLSLAGVFFVHGFDARVTQLGVAAAIAAALCAAIAYSLVRKLRDEDHPLVVVFYFTILTIPMVLPFAGRDWVFPQGLEWGTLMVLGTMTQAAQYFMTRAYQGAPAASVTNLSYLTVIYALIIGYFAFDEAIRPMALLGILLIIFSAVLSSRFSQRV